MPWAVCRQVAPASFVIQAPAQLTPASTVPSASAQIEWMPGRS